MHSDHGREDGFRHILDALSDGATCDARRSGMAAFTAGLGEARR